MTTAPRSGFKFMETNISQFEEETIIQPEFSVDENFGYSEFTFEEINKVQNEKPEKFESELKSISDVVENEKLSLEWEKSENNGNEKQVVLKRDSRELVYKNEDGKEVSFSEQLIGTQYEQEHVELLNDLYEKGYAISSLVDPISGKEFITAYFADEKGNVTTASFERDFEKSETEEKTELLEANINITEGLEGTIELFQINEFDNATTQEINLKNLELASFSIEGANEDESEQIIEYQNNLEYLSEEDEEIDIPVIKNIDKLNIFIPTLETPTPEAIQINENKVDLDVVREPKSSIFDLFKLNFEPVQDIKATEVKTKTPENKETQEIKIAFQALNKTIESKKQEITNTPTVEKNILQKPIFIREIAPTSKLINTPKFVATLNKELQSENIIVSEIYDTKLEELKELNPENKSGIYLEIIEPQEEINFGSPETESITQEQIIERVVKNIETSFKPELKTKQSPQAKKEVLIKPTRETEIVKSLAEEVTEFKTTDAIELQDNDIETKDLNESIITSIESKGIKIIEDADYKPTIEEISSDEENFGIEEKSKIETISEIVDVPENLFRTVPNNKPIAMRDNTNESILRNNPLRVTLATTDESLLDELNGIKIEALAA